MPRYHVNARFGPWRVGDEFESEDELHAKMAANGGLLVEVNNTALRPADPPSSELQDGDNFLQQDETTDAAAPEQPLWGDTGWT